MDLLSQNRTYHEAQSSMELLPNYYAWTYGKFKNYILGDIVELGCGSGVGISNYIDDVSKIYVVDHNEELLNRIKNRYPQDKVFPLSADLIGDWNGLSEIKADAVIMMDVVEHFKDDVNFINKAKTLMKNTGKLIIKVPAQSSLYSDMDRASGHYRRYDKKDLWNLAENTGLRIKFIKHINPIGALVYRLRNDKKSNLSRTFSPTQLKLINAALPLLSLADHIPFLPGLSLITVMENKI